MPVEKQIAIIYCGTMGLLKDVPVNKVKELKPNIWISRIETP
jgi:F-type H+-transporting ATPase subunit alpha